MTGRNPFEGQTVSVRLDVPAGDHYRFKLQSAVTGKTMQELYLEAINQQAEKLRREFQPDDFPHNGRD